jgi:hypothetical protein
MKFVKGAGLKQEPQADAIAIAVQKTKRTVM